MNKRKPAPKKRKMPLKQRAARAVVRYAEQREREKAQKAAAKRSKQNPPRKSTAQRTGAPTRRPAGSAPRAGQAPVRRPRPAAKTQRAERAAYIRQRRRRQKAARIVLGVLAVLIVFLILSRTVLFKIQHIDITNPEDANYTAEQIVAQSGIVYGTQNLFSCDLEKVQKNIEQRLPYIGRAQVERNFPASLQVTVTPTKAAAAMDYGTGYLLIDRDGKMLESTETAPEDIPVLRCGTEFELNLGQYIGVSANSKKADDKTKAAAEMMALYKKVNTAVEAAKLNDITLIDIRDVRAITLMYQNRLTLHLGNDSSLEDKLRTAAKVIAEESDTSSTRTGAIDLTTVRYAYSRDTFDPAIVEASTEPESTTETQESSDT